MRHRSADALIARPASTHAARLTPDARAAWLDRPIHRDLVTAIIAAQGSMRRLADAFIVWPVSIQSIKPTPDARTAGLDRPLQLGLFIAQIVSKDNIHRLVDCAKIVRPAFILQVTRQMLNAQSVGQERPLHRGMHIA